MDEAERELFDGTIRRACAEVNGNDLDGALVEVGWHEALAVDPRTAVSSLFEALGTTNHAASPLDAVVGSALGLVGRPSVPIVMPRLGLSDPPGRLGGDRLVVDGMGTATLSGSATAWVAVDCGKGLLVEVSTSELGLAPVTGLDPSLHMVSVAGDGVRLGTSHQCEPAAWQHAAALAQLAIAHQLVGASRTMLELARHHALERIQFGRPIASFQAVRHHLAETLVAIEASDAALGSAWDERTSGAAATAKALAGRTARTTVRHCQQVLAGIGFTTEHDFHHYVRRVLVLDQLFGSSLSLTREFGRDLLANRQLPALPPL